MDMMDLPYFVEDYLNYMESIRGCSSNTVKEYYFNLRLFFRFMKRRKRLVDPRTDLKDVDIYDLDIDFVKSLNIQDLHSFIAFADKELGNSSSTKARKVAAIRSFFEYMHLTVELIDKNPSLNLEFPKIEKRNPSYLSLDDSMHLLEVAKNNPNKEQAARNYCILMLFLNCGLRLSELVNIDIEDLKNMEYISIIGKGNKERFVYLNKATREAIEGYMDFRSKKDLKSRALFISERNQRMSNRAVQHMVKNTMEEAGLSNEYSTHSLRHTAATLMYKYGNVDIRALQEVLGHESVSTTQIYTHLDNEGLKSAIDSNPLSDI